MLKKLALLYFATKLELGSETMHNAVKDLHFLDVALLVISNKDMH